MIKLSIIIPHYNTTNSLEFLLNSIPSNKGIEIIIVDDRSSLDCKENLNILKNNTKHEDIYFYENTAIKKGAGSCRNIGMKYAKGKWLLFADADDYFVEGFYDYVSSYFDSSNEVVFFTPTSLETETATISDRHLPYQKVIKNYIKEKNTRNELKLRYEFPVPWSKLIRADLLKEKEIKFDEIIASNDVMFSAKVGYNMNEFEVTENVIYCVTRNKGSLTVNISEEIFDCRLKTFLNYSDYLRLILTKKEKKYLELQGTGFILKVIQYRLGLKKMLSTYLLLKKSKIKIISFNFLNPIHIKNVAISQYKHHKKTKKYFHNK